MTRIHWARSPVASIRGWSWQSPNLGPVAREFLFPAPLTMDFAELETKREMFQRKRK